MLLYLIMLTKSALRKNAVSLLLLLVVSGTNIHANAAGIKAGDVAPAVELTTLPSGNGTISLQALKGKVVYLDFWASWCGPCRISLPQLNTLRHELGSQGFEVLAISVDEFEPDALKFLEEFPVDYPVAWDPAGTSPQQYGVLGMPTAYLVDRKGVIRHVHPGFRKGDTEGIRSMVLELLQESVGE